MTSYPLVLVVEDSPADAMFIREQLRESAPDFRYAHVSRLTDAIKYMEGHIPFIVLLDTHLPDSEGLETVKRIRDVAPRTPIVVLTGNDDAQFGAACLESGAQDFVVKHHVTPERLAWDLRNAAARMRVELALQQSEANHRGLFENSCFPIAQIRPDGVILRVNPGFTALMGEVEVSEEHPTNIAEYFTDVDLFDAITEYQSTAFRDVETTWRRRDGTIVTVLLSGRHVRGSAPEDWWIELIVQDIGERRALEEQLLQVQRHEAVAQLAGGVAHDLNNVLAIIMAEAESARAAHRANPTAKIDVELDAIQESTRRGARLVKDLLGYSGQQQLALQMVDLQRVVNDVVSMVRRIVPETIRLTVEKNTTSRWAEADPKAVEQMLMNLVSNARDAVEQNGEIAISTSTVAVTESEIPCGSQAQPGSFVRIRVADTGCGMAPDVFARAFEPFFSTKPKGIGTGLGLSSVHGLAAQHAGFVSIQSHVGRGTIVDILIPAGPAPGASVADSQADSPEAMLRGTETILLVDDEAGLRRVGARLLERFGYKVLTAANGVEGLNEYRARAAEIDLILTDVVMPAMSGLELRQCIVDEGGSVPILFMSGYSEEELPRIVETGGPISTIDKPWEIAEMLGAVREALDHHSPEPIFGADRRDGDSTYRGKARLETTDGSRNRYSVRPKPADQTFAAELKDAVRHARFHLHFQPEYAVATRQIVAVEALLRWKRRCGTVVPPGEFLPALEELGLMAEVGAWVLSAACNSLGQLRGYGPERRRIAVNVAAEQLLDTRFLSVVEQTLREASMEPSALELEVNELTLMQDASAVRDVMCELRGLGVRVAIDDFGTGCPSLASLGEFDVNVLKVDQSYITAIDENARRAIIVNSLVALGREADLEVVAEGVETLQQVERLRECRCQIMQGFYFGKPGADVPPIPNTASPG